MYNGYLLEFCLIVKTFSLYSDAKTRTSSTCIVYCVVQVDLSAAGCHAGPILSSLVQKGQDLTEKFQLLKVDRQEFVCMKFLIVFNPG